jgi:hypothetical protein
MHHGAGLPPAIPGHIHGAQVAVHLQLLGQPHAAGPRLRQQGQGRFQGQLGLVADGGIHHPLGHRPHLDHQAAGPLLHQIAPLVGVPLVQIDR